MDPAAGPRPRAAAGRDRVFREYDPGAQYLLPPSVDEWLPGDHQARFVGEAVDELLDLGPVYASYESAEGAPPYDPSMMLKLLLWGYSCGVTSAREMERRCATDVAFRFLAANQAPDYRSLARFRRRHLAAVSELFTQVLALCQEAGLVKLGRVALDGTKLRANASRHKAMSYGRLGPRIEQLQGEVDRLLAEAERVDRAEDEAFGEDRRGDELPEGLARRETRLAKLRAAKAAIEADARDKAEAAARKKAEATARKKGKGADGEPPGARPDDDDAAVEAAAAAAREAAAPKTTDQRNFTDPDARIMKTADGSFHYAYNGQAVVDETSQVIVATRVTQAPTDVNQLHPMIAAMGEQLDAAGLAARPRVLLADAGYCSEENLAPLDGLGFGVLIATGRLKHGEGIPAAAGDAPPGATLKERMAGLLRTEQGKADYARRKAIVEPVFGQTKVKQQAGQLRLRGLAGAAGEFTLHAVAHNLRKLGHALAGPAWAPA